MGLRQNNEGSQRVFFNQYSEVLCRYLFHTGKANNNMDAQEIISNTFLKAFKGINTFNGKSSLKTWLFQIAKNAATDFYKSPKNRHEDLPLDQNAQVSGCQDILDNTLELEKQEKIRELLQKLNEEQREAIAIHIIDGFSIRDTSQVMGKTEGAVKMLLLRAKQNIRQNIEKSPYFKDFISTKGGVLQ